MPYLQDELLAPLLLDERLRAAERRRLGAALTPRSGPLTRVEIGAARLLYAGGARLERAARRRAGRQGWRLSADLCPGCGA